MLVNSENTQDIIIFGCYLIFGMPLFFDGDLMCHLFPWTVPDTVLANLCLLALLALLFTLVSPTCAVLAENAEVLPPQHEDPLPLAGLSQRPAQSTAATPSTLRQAALAGV